MLVEGELGLLDIKVAQQHAGGARVLAGDHVDALERLDGAQGHIAKVANGGCDKVEHVVFPHEGPLSAALTNHSAIIANLRPDERMPIGGMYMTYKGPSPVVEGRF